MKEKMKKVSVFLKKFFGYGIMISLFGGGASFFGYIVALIVGGDAAAKICDVIYNSFLPIMIFISSVMVLLGLVAMYFGGELSLTAEKKNKK